MATPKDAPYKVEQRDLKARAKAMPASDVGYDHKGQAINPARRAKKANLVEARLTTSQKRALFCKVVFS